ncbi:PREDICTED: probable receptor-like protein kinase At5g47070 [Fragaria vesca subsp. vesca]|uniref:probable receptor-like protein kinase At5g47070 n=1 Tax=Fragaria vesca subsp. vesca TaxID=101020 RepID=UPI0002C2E21D|nr:PREDICTED: probable receptor-like protein kinase At5g47070 [Fragaria vesca subsp. vesca]XP_011468117.1 PREDICTED: probable receptor-like protein kinase At5g47070 [Fragaria vesca subsp. vesca]XP_011468118.1 PREDICTED: probable receptor-like protein kinase At5g47070 [Fragaria vesca subsp. vesca]XP_011468119.1 PREDICTED: probable receptor-like protein kinase At5g47070 [Fragaria vesca subsp. vesca]
MCCALLEAMKCFSFHVGDKKDEPKSPNTMFTDGDMKRSGSELDSQNISDASSESLRRNQYPSFSQRPSNLRIFTVSELKSATKNFGRSGMVGEGGFGCVYKGQIRSSEDPSQKIEVAVKQLSKRGLQGHKEWVTEVNVLGVVEHPNLVKLVGYCAEDDERGIQRLLIYEYMPNGSVENHLSSRSDAPLSWAMRLKIAQDAARGLTYLHEEMDFQIIFRDFKSSNILLDKEWNAKLSDFGMARLGPAEGVSHVSTAVVGTMGYAAPEYIQTGRLTSKNDVWSYGVFLYELITGRRPLDRNRPKSEQKLLEWVKPYLSDLKKFRLIIDPRLEGKYPLKSVQKLAIVANRCLVRLPKNRPKMSEVLEMVNQIIEAPSGQKKNTEAPSGQNRFKEAPPSQNKIKEAPSGHNKVTATPTGKVSLPLPPVNTAPIETSREYETVSKKRNVETRRGETGLLSRVWTPKLLRTC